MQININRFKIVFSYPRNNNKISIKNMIYEMQTPSYRKMSINA